MNKKQIPRPPRSPKCRIVMEGIGRLCNCSNVDDGPGCRKRWKHRGQCKYNLTMWEKFERILDFFKSI